MKKLLLLACLLAVSLSLDARDRKSVYGPDYGAFDGEVITRADPKVYDLLVVAVDGKHHPDLPTKVKMRPGFHWLEVASSKRGRNGELTRQSLPLNVESCTTYRYAAKHDGSLSNRRWSIIGIEAVTDLDCPANRGKADEAKDGGIEASKDSAAAEPGTH